MAAGQPVLAEENIEEYVPVPQIAGGDEGEFVLRVKGDSMVGAGIFEGDYVVVRPQETAADGEIVVALVEDEATVKRFFRENDHVRLQPENDDARADPQPRRPAAGSRGGRVQEGAMSTALLDPPARLFGESPLRPPAQRRPAHARGAADRASGAPPTPTGAADCPLCGSAMALRDAAAECGSCGSRLS